MRNDRDQVAIVIGASPLAERVRRRLVQRGVCHAGVTSHLRGLRRSLAVDEGGTAVLLVALDRATRARHGDELRRLIADHRGLGGGTPAVGLLPEEGLSPEIAELGCDVFVHTADEAARTLDLLVATTGRHPGSASASRFSGAAGRCTVGDWPGDIEDSAFPGEDDFEYPPPRG